MYTQNEKEWILEAINHLKRRKARPDITRISLRMKRKHKITFAQTRQVLDSLVESGIVVKAVYKNNTSYRDVSKWKKGKLGGQILNSNRMLQRFVKAITAAQSSANDGKKGTGVSAQEIEEWLSQENEDKCFLSGAALKAAIENEVSNGFLFKIEIDNESLYNVNFQKVDNDLDPSFLNCVKSEEIIHGNGKVQVSRLDNQPDSMINNSSLTIIRMAIDDTEGKRGSGSTFTQIENWINSNQACKNSPLSGNKSVLLQFLKKQVKSGDICQSSHENSIVFSYINPESKSADYIALKVSTLKMERNDGEIQINGKNNSVSLRPPSKRKRTIKSHGPDFEMELPTKSRAKVVNCLKDSFPTPLDSPVSEKSEAILEASFKCDQQKKRGRPKKSSSKASNQTVSVKEEIDSLDYNMYRNGGPSEESSICQEGSEDCMSEELPDATTWTSQQVADYFFEQGYQEESKQMLENDVDGAALCLLRRSDIVGPPAGGMFKIKKLGIALKLFRDVRNLLYFGNADNYSDPYEEGPCYRS